jgi:hypothetical protein
VNTPWVWVGLCALFVLPFLRRPVRWMHLDLAVLLAFSISYAFFGAANLDVSVPSAYPLLAYLLVRMLMVAAARSRALAGRTSLPEPPPLLVAPASFSSRSCSSPAFGWPSTSPTATSSTSATRA